MEIAKQNKEKYIQETEAYKQKKDKEAAKLRKEEEEYMKLQKQEALQLLRKKEKILIKKTKKNHQKKKQNKEHKNSDPNKPNRPASSFLLFSKEARKSLHEEQPGINNSTLNALVSVKWKELTEEEKQVWNDKAAEAMDAYKKELEEHNKFVAASLDQKKKKRMKSPSMSMY